MIIQLKVRAAQPKGLVNLHPRYLRWPRINRCSVRIVQAPLCTWCQIGIGPTCGVSGSLMAAFQVCLISHGPRKPLRHAIVSARARLPTITRDHHACSVYDRSRVQNAVCSSVPHSPENRVPQSDLMQLDPRDAVRFSALSSPDEILAGAANPYHAARPRRVSAAGLRPLQAKLSRNSNQIARGGICQFESYMPSHAVGLHH